MSEPEKEAPPDNGFIDQMREIVRLASANAPMPVNFKTAERSPACAKLVGALAKAQGAIRMASKESEAVIVGGRADFKYRYADLAAVWEVAREPLSKNGLAVLQPAAVDGQRVCVVTYVAHESGEWMSCAIALVAKDAAPQSIGSAITYARRYGLSAMVGIASEIDDDAAAAQPVKGAQPAAAAAAPAKTKKDVAAVDEEPIVSKYGEHKGKELKYWPDDYLGEVMENLCKTLADASKKGLHVKVGGQLVRMQTEAIGRLSTRLGELDGATLAGRVELMRKVAIDPTLAEQRGWNQKLLSMYEGEQTRRLAQATGTKEVA